MSGSKQTGAEKAQVLMETTSRFMVPAIESIRAAMCEDRLQVQVWAAVRHGHEALGSLRDVFANGGEVGVVVRRAQHTLADLVGTEMVEGRLHLPLSKILTGVRHVVHSCHDLVESVPGGLAGRIPTVEDLGAMRVCRLLRLLREEGLEPGAQDTLYQMLVRRDGFDVTYSWLERTLRSERRLHANAR